MMLCSILITSTVHKNCPSAKCLNTKGMLIKNIKLCEHYANVHKEKHWIIVILSELFSF